MSTRWYPLYQKGNPQLRVFLPNFWMKIVRPEHKQADNVVTFKVSMEMTEHDVRNYLRDIYKVPVMDVKTRIVMGEFYKDLHKKYVKKKQDDKFAFVTLPPDVKFEFPNIFPEDKGDEDPKGDADKAIIEMRKKFKNFEDRSKSRPGLPGWFSI